MKVKDYDIAKAKDSETLAREVFDLLKEGWEPIGGVALDNQGYLCQAMIKKYSKD